MEVAVDLGLLVAAPGIVPACIVLYGMGIGIRSIVRGTVPPAMCGREGYDILIGRLGLPTLLATAAAPMVGTWLLEWVGPSGTLARGARGSPPCGRAFRSHPRPTAGPLPGSIRGIFRVEFRSQ